MRRIGVMAAVLLVAFAGLAAADGLDLEKARLERNKETVKAFYTTFMNNHDPEGAMKKYVGAEYRQHNPFVRDGKEGFIAAFKDVFQRNPKARMEIKRVVAEGDFVVVHVHHLDPDRRQRPGLHGLVPPGFRRQDCGALGCDAVGAGGP